MIYVKQIFNLKTGSTEIFIFARKKPYVIQIFWYVIGLFNRPQTNRKDNEKGI